MTSICHNLQAINNQNSQHLLSNQHTNKESIAMQAMMDSFLNELLEYVDVYASPVNLTIAVSAMLLVSVGLFMYDQFTANSQTNSTRGKYAKYADENNDDPNEPSYSPDDSESSSESPKVVRRSSRLRNKRKN